MKKLILCFGFLAIISVSVNLSSCSKDDEEVSEFTNDYSNWMQLTEADSVIYAQAREAYLNDPANANSADYKIMQFLSDPYAVRTKAENGMNYQFACRDCVVTVFMGNGEYVGKVTAIEMQNGADSFIGPVKRDTIFTID